jgi:hypothetical protein
MGAEALVEAHLSNLAFSLDRVPELFEIHSKLAQVTYGFAKFAHPNVAIVVDDN